MRRFITKDLEYWKNTPDRKPLIIKGARQVGKTYIVRAFGEDFYDNTAYFNFDQDQSLKSLFESTKDPRRIMEQLSLASGQKIAPGGTLIFFDEIQECPDALNSLKYFQEDAPEYHVIAAGSLLGVRLSHTSFPVGKVDFLNLYPMSFSEFLLATGDQNLVDFLRATAGNPAPVPDLFREQLEEKLKAYFIVGGMPEVVRSWSTERDVVRVNDLQEAILTSYEQDFGKHVTASEANRISLTWHGIPTQLSKENKKFVYNTIKTGARAREYENALNWLRDAGLVYKIHNITKPAFPLKAYQDLSAFKVYLHDIGLLRNLSELDSSIILQGNRLFQEFKGALTENYCLTALKSTRLKGLSYYTFDRYEVDFMAQWKDLVLPIEVKSSAGSAHASLTQYNSQYRPPVYIRFSTGNLSLDGNVLNIPLYLAEYLEEILRRI